MLPSLKKEEATYFLRKADSMCLQEAVRDLDRAFQNFFTHRARYPRFKKRKIMYGMTYRTRNQSNGIRITDRNHIHLPVLGNVKIKLSREPDGKILNATVSATPTGKYFVSLCVSGWHPYKKDAPHTEIGIDVGSLNSIRTAVAEVCAHQSLFQSIRSVLQERREDFPA